MTARSRELVALVLAGLVAGVALASVVIAREAAVRPGAAAAGALFLGVYLVAHLVVRWTAPSADGALLPLAAILTAFGLAFTARIDPADGARQALWVVIGIGVLAAVLVTLRHDYRVLESYRYLFGIATVGLLLLPALPGIGATRNGARLWVDLGLVQFQPGELAKLCLVVFLAGYLREKREVLAQGRLKDFGPLLAIWGGAMLVILLTEDLGSALLVFGLFLAMLYVATGRALFVATGLGLFVAGAAILYGAVERVRERVTIWLVPWTEEKVYCALNGELEYRQDCASYQLVKSLYSIANGGFGGTGIGRGTFTAPDGSALIPFLQTDFIYSAIAQEVGLIGASALLLCLMLLVVRGMRIALRAEDGFSKLLASGLAFGFAFQTFLIVGGILRIVPLTGITLPFVSYGGTSIVASFAALALLLLVSNRANAPR
ncbi:MAG: FtsW/RodA/SpoVE family cell cycle protein [Thermoleophilia bacterium]|nr:FtsW/RodA/SpoVE family cell cycle protein [Gaiellaceae bacterium]MDW8338000.1 FtsW/RodA/SpoVE family cell cycle protein [Thermoleophilia bacterium]